MGLGRNDALGFTKKPLSPCRLQIANVQASNGTTYGQAVRFVSVLENSSNGAFEFIQDVALGDRVVIKTPGMYCILWTIYGGATLSTALAKNAQSSPTDILNTSIASVFTNAPASNKAAFLTYSQGATAALSAIHSVTSWLNSGDVIWFLANNNGTPDSAMATVEYLGGAG